MIKKSLGLKVAAGAASFGAMLGAAYEYGQLTTPHGDTYNYNYYNTFAADDPNTANNPDNWGSRLRAAGYAGTCSVIGSEIKNGSLRIQVSTDPYSNTTDYRYDSQMPPYLPLPVPGEDAYTARSITLNNILTNANGSETVPATPLPKGGPHSADTEATFSLPLPGADPTAVDSLVTITAHTDAGDMSCGSPAPDAAGVFLLTPEGIRQ
jgi:hypothetical protein